MEILLGYVRDLQGNALSKSLATTCASARVRTEYEEVCLIDVLRAHSFKIVYAEDGPFWAIQDGNRFLAETKWLGCATCSSGRLCC